MAQRESENRNLRSDTVKSGREKGYFQKGNSGKPKGAISEKTKLWNKLGEFVKTDMTEKFMVEVMTLEGREFVQAYKDILEFFKPKLARQEIKAEVNDVTVRSFNVVPASIKKSDSGNSNK